MTSRISLGYKGDISCALMLLSVLLELDLESSWGTWLHTVELKLTLIRLKQSTVYSHLGILKRSRS